MPSASWWRQGHQLCLLPRRGHQLRLLPRQGHQFRLLHRQGHQLHLLLRQGRQLCLVRVVSLEKSLVHNSRVLERGKIVRTLICEGIGVFIVVES